jgi:hypothetical protein
VLLGFAGLLAAIVGQLNELNVSVVIGVATAIVAAFFALMAAFPRSLFETDPVLVDDEYKRLMDAELTEEELRGAAGDGRRDDYRHPAQLHREERRCAEMQAPLVDRCGGVAARGGYGDWCGDAVGDRVVEVPESRVDTIRPISPLPSMDSSC